MCLSVNHDDKASYAHAFLFNDFCISDVSKSVVDWLFMASDHCQLKDHKMIIIMWYHMNQLLL